MIAPLTEVPAGLAGRRLDSVAYRHLDSPYEPGDGVDGDLVAVILGFADGDRTITWAMDGEIEGLAVLAEPLAGRASSVTDVSGRWPVGESLRAVDGAWQEPGVIWALRLAFESTAVVVALGTVESEVAYMPDEVVAIFDAATARAYRPSGAVAPAWGG